MPQDTTSFSQIVGSSIASFLLALLFLRVYLPLAPKRPGEPIGKIRLGLREKMMVLRPTLIPLLLLVLLDQLPGPYFQLILPCTEILVLVGLIIVFSLPVSYVFTTQGYSLSNTQFFAWRQFKRFEVRGATVILHGKGERPISQRLYIPPHKHEVLVALLKKYVK